MRTHRRPGAQTSRYGCPPGVLRREVVPVTAGPYETEAQARAAARHITSEPPGTGAWQAGSHRMLCQALAAAGVELGDYDHDIVQWLAGWEPSTVAVVAGWIARAHQAGGQP